MKKSLLVVNSHCMANKSFYSDEFEDTSVTNLKSSTSQIERSINPPYSIISKLCQAGRNVVLPY